MAALFNDVLGDAIAVAVRRACDDVGRAPYGELGREGVLDLRDEDHDTDSFVGNRPPPPGVDDPYEVLGLPPGATWERIAAAHRRLARLWHPDGAGEDERAQREDLIRRLNAAYAELRTRRKR